MSQKERDALITDAKNLLDSDMHEIKGGYECETGCRQTCAISCASSRSK